MTHAERNDRKAHLASFAVFVVTAAACLWAFFAIGDPWRWPAMLALFIVGGVIGERLFQAWATPEGIRREMRDRIDSQD